MKWKPEEFQYEAMTQLHIRPQARQCCRFSLRVGFFWALLISAATCAVLVFAGIANRIWIASSDTTASRAAHLLRGSAHLDVAPLNLHCAKELPGAESLNVEQAQTIIESMATRVANETGKYLSKFKANAADFNNSEGYFRILTLVTVLQQDFGVHYNPERIRSPNFADSRDLFLHGLLTGKREGTCVSMPVLYVAVGRRLGYPLKLVTTKGHLFARWEGRRTERLTSPTPLPKGAERDEKIPEVGAYERFNIEATGQGLSCFPDEYYHAWPEPLTPKEIASGQYLNSLTPKEELAVFLSARGNWVDPIVAYTDCSKSIPRNWRSRDPRRLSVLWN